MKNLSFILLLFITNNYQSEAATIRVNHEPNVIENNSNDKIMYNVVLFTNGTKISSEIYDKSMNINKNYVSSLMKPLNSSKWVEDEKPENGLAGTIRRSVKLFVNDTDNMIKNNSGFITFTRKYLGFLEHTFQPTSANLYKHWARFGNSNFTSKANGTTTNTIPLPSSVKRPNSSLVGSNRLQNNSDMMNITININVNRSQMLDPPQNPKVMYSMKIYDSGKNNKVCDKVTNIEVIQIGSQEARDSEQECSSQTREISCETASNTEKQSISDTTLITFEVNTDLEMDIETCSQFIGSTETPTCQSSTNMSSDTTENCTRDSSQLDESVRRQGGGGKCTFPTEKTCFSEETEPITSCCPVSLIVRTDVVTGHEESTECSEISMSH